MSRITRNDHASALQVLALNGYVASELTTRLDCALFTGHRQVVGLTPARWPGRRTRSAFAPLARRVRATAFSPGA